ncbi:MAG: capsule biosynthesis protein CapA, partial [Pseudomonadota bacterium]
MRSIRMPQRRVFLCLQGPHGPFFSSLARQLERAGAEVWRVGFNAGDQMFWHRKDRFIAFRDDPDDWPSRCAALFDELNVTDLVIYGDTRPIHANAVQLADARQIAVHSFEEGYLRPYWVTYELGGTNGHSPLMRMSLTEILTAMDRKGADAPPPPCHWGDMRDHIFWGAAYHGLVLAFNQGYPKFRPHRSLRVAQEFKLYLKRFLLMPLHAIDRWRATRAVRRGSFPYHV